jgi:hypothetical protein
LDSQISAALTTKPGGTAVSGTEVIWDDGTRLVLSSDPRGVACSSGKYCVHSKINGSGDRVEYSRCPATTDLSTVSFTIKSIKNSRTSGTLTARKGSTTMATIAAGSYRNITGITSLVCA